MNGRAYDYNLGRFLSVDPFVQAPGNSQSMNPYSYIMNNPLAGTDPSGYLACDESTISCQENLKNCGPVCLSADGGNSGSGNSNTPVDNGFKGTQGAVGQGNSPNVGDISSIGSPATATDTNGPTGGFGDSVIRVDTYQGGATIVGRRISGGTEAATGPSLGATATSIGADVLPVVGSLKAFGQMITGTDWVTGESVSRWGEAGGILLGMVPGGRLLGKADEVAALGQQVIRQADEGSSYLYHYTKSEHVDSIMKHGLDPQFGGGKVFTTPAGNLSPIQAQLDLALPPNGLRDSLIKIDAGMLEKMGIKIPKPRNVQRDFNMPGGGKEIIFDIPIPPEALRQVR